jgi:hypothetical protein
MEKSLTDVKKEIEKEAEDKVKAIPIVKLLKNPENCIQIMKEGEKKFIEQTGRHMTYSEMREMFG